MSADRRLLLASHNRGKLRELRELLRDTQFRIISLDEFPELQSVKETGNTFAQNASLKATGYARQTELLTIADDSGLEVKALGNRPGVFSARYAGPGASDQERIQKLLLEMASLPSQERSARFSCALAIADEEGGVIHISNGVCEGHIAFEPKGSGGFGYDPIFIPEGYQQTFGELNPQVKNQISHRARALTGASKFLRSLTGSFNDG